MSFTYSLHVVGINHDYSAGCDVVYQKLKRNAHIQTAVNVKWITDSEDILKYLTRTISSS